MFWLEFKLRYCCSKKKKIDETLVLFQVRRANLRHKQTRLGPIDWKQLPYMYSSRSNTISNSFLGEIQRGLFPNQQTMRKIRTPLTTRTLRYVCVGTCRGRRGG